MLEEKFEVVTIKILEKEIGLAVRIASVVYLVSPWEQSLLDAFYGIEAVIKRRIRVKNPVWQKPFGGTATFVQKINRQSRDFTYEQSPSPCMFKNLGLDCGFETS